MMLKLTVSPAQILVGKPATVGSAGALAVGKDIVFEEIHPFTSFTSTL